MLQLLYPLEPIVLCGILLHCPQCFTGPEVSTMTVGSPVKPSARSSPVTLREYSVRGASPVFPCFLEALRSPTFPCYHLSHRIFHTSASWCMHRNKETNLRSTRPVSRWADWASAQCGLSPFCSLCSLHRAHYLIVYRGITRTINYNDKTNCKETSCLVCEQLGKSLSWCHEMNMYLSVYFGQDVSLKCCT